MGTIRTVRFVGGPLHGESRTVESAQAEYRIPFFVATALATAMRGIGEASAPPGQEFLVYARRKDGRYYLRAEAPAGFEKVPEGFTFDWFDVSGGVLLVEISGPPSEIGHVTTELRLSLEFLTDPATIEEGPALLLEDARELLEQHERRAIRDLPPDRIHLLADALEAGTPASRQLGNRRVAALIIREWADPGGG